MFLLQSLQITHCPRRKDLFWTSPFFMNKWHRLRSTPSTSAGRSKCQQIRHFIRRHVLGWFLNTSQWVIYEEAKCVWMALGVLSDCVLQFFHSRVLFVVFAACSGGPWRLHTKGSELKFVSDRTLPSTWNRHWLCTNCVTNCSATIPNMIWWIWASFSYRFTSYSPWKWSFLIVRVHLAWKIGWQFRPKAAIQLTHI